MGQNLQAYNGLAATQGAVSKTTQIYVEDCSFINFDVTTTTSTDDIVQFRRTHFHVYYYGNVFWTPVEEIFPRGMIGIHYNGTSYMIDCHLRSMQHLDPGILVNSDMSLGYGARQLVFGASISASYLVIGLHYGCVVFNPMGFPEATAPVAGSYYGNHGTRFYIFGNTIQFGATNQFTYGPSLFSMDYYGGTEVVGNNMNVVSLYDYFWVSRNYFDFGGNGYLDNEVDIGGIGPWRVIGAVYGLWLQSGTGQFNVEGADPSVTSGGRYNRCSFYLCNTGLFFYDGNKKIDDFQIAFVHCYNSIFADSTNTFQQFNGTGSQHVRCHIPLKGGLVSGTGSANTFNLIIQGTSPATGTLP